MSNINAIYSSLYTSTTLSASTNTPPSLSLTANPNYTQAFTLSLTQQGSNSSEFDEVVLSATGYDANGDGVAMASMSTGNSAESAYESMMASIGSFGGISGSGQAGNGAGGYSNPLDPIFAQMEKTLGNNNGTVSVSGGFVEFAVNSDCSVSSSSNTAPANSSETLTQFVDTVVTSVENEFSSLSSESSITISNSLTSQIAVS